MAKKPGNTRDPLRDCAGTPRDFFAHLHEKHLFTVDACALPFNAKLDRYWSPEQDGLAQDWTGERIWINPTYGKGLIQPWVEKALERKALLSVMLLPSRTEMPWFHRLWKEAEIEFLTHRIQFDAPPGLEQDFKKSTNFERSFLVVIR